MICELSYSLHEIAAQAAHLAAPLGLNLFQAHPLDLLRGWRRQRKLDLHRILSLDACPTFKTYQTFWILQLCRLI